MLCILPTTSTVSLIVFMTPVVLLFTLCALLAEPRIGKELAKRLQGDSRNNRNCTKPREELELKIASLLEVSVSSSLWWPQGGILPPL